MLSGRIIGIYPENKTCIFLIDGDCENEAQRMEISKLFPTKKEAILSALKPIEETIKIIREQLSEWTNPHYKPEERERKEIQLERNEMAAEFLKSQLDESEAENEP